MTASTSLCACALSMLYLAPICVTRSSLLLSASSSCSENLPHLELISLTRICLASAGLTVFGVTGFTSVISKILMKHHLNVHHSNNTLYVGMNCANHSGEAIIVRNINKAASGQHRATAMSAIGQRND